MAINKRLIKSNDEGGVVPAESFNTVLYTGNSTNDFSTSLTQSITGVGFQPDLVWIKGRDDYGHGFFDIVRGAAYRIASHSTAAENQSDGYLKSFDSNGFGLGGDFAFNRSGYNYVAWCFKGGGTAVSNTDGSITSTVSANPDAGFSVVKWTADGNGFSSSIGHGLNASPELIITKDTDTSNDWIVTSSLFSNPTRNFLKINLSDAVGLSSVDYYDLSTSTFKVGVRNLTVGKEIISYCFHSVDGYQKVGSYTGTGVSGNTVTTGFRPRFVMYKNTSSATSWVIIDSVRGAGTNGKYLFANTSGAEGTYTILDFTDTGFTLNDTDNTTNGSGSTYIYLAIA